MTYINLTLSVISGFAGLLYFCLRKFLKRTEYTGLSITKSEKSSDSQGEEDGRSKDLFFADSH